MPLRCTALANPLKFSCTCAAIASALLLCSGYASAAPPSATAKAAAQPQAAAWRTPPAARLGFTVQGKVKNFPYQTKAQIDWLPQGDRYEASQELQVPLLGSRRQSSTGRIGKEGLQPEIFMDRSRNERSTTFDAQAGQIRFSRGYTPVAWASGIQDRMSVFFQVAGMLAAAPQRYPQGSKIELPTASTSRVTPWVFTVRGVETLQLPAGTMRALKLEHHSDSADADGIQSAIWLAPQLQYLPVRIRLLEDGGRDEVDLKLHSHTKP